MAINLPEEQRRSLLSRSDDLKRRYADFAAQGLKLDMTRGKPGPEQLDLAADLLTVVGPGETDSEGGVDCRNYGGVDGLPEMKALFAEMLGCSSSEVIIGGNASLTLMHDTFVRALMHGVPGGDGPWLHDPSGGNEPVKWLCPSPGYDRHFKVAQHNGAELIRVGMGPDGPDMDEVERLAAADHRIKGLWAVPRYSNPTGAVYSEEVIHRLARMSAAPDFRIFWDNAYAEHHLVDDPQPLANILDACKAAGHPDRVFMFASTSKITFAGAGVSCFASSEANVAWMRKHTAIATIGPDKLNQLRHVRFFGGLEGLRAHMKKHAELLKPRFDAVLTGLKAELGDSGLASWSKPEGGYFISVDTPEGCAARTVALAAEAGVKLTPAGATYPYGRDPRDQNIRIAPSLPPVKDLEVATELFGICVQLAALESM